MIEIRELCNSYTFMSLIFFACMPYSLCCGGISIQQIRCISQRRLTTITQNRIHVLVSFNCILIIQKRIVFIHTMRFKFYDHYIEDSHHIVRNFNPLCAHSFSMYLYNIECTLKTGEISLCVRSSACDIVSLSLSSVKTAQCVCMYV